MMTFLRILALGLLFFSPVAAQSNVETKVGDTVHLRALDIITGIVKDLEIKVGETLAYERLLIEIDECRFPVANATGDAFAYLVIHDVREDAPRFEGWMIASSPALSAMDHPRYDVWLLSCSTSEG